VPLRPLLPVIEDTKVLAPIPNDDAALLTGGFFKPLVMNPLPLAESMEETNFII
jgi:hypothetical protein